MWVGLVEESLQIAAFLANQTPQKMRRGKAFKFVFDLDDDQSFQAASMEGPYHLLT
jgi:hypothetical protein